MTSSEIIRVDVSFDRSGELICCCACDTVLRWVLGGDLEHPAVKGFFRKTPIQCQFAGRRFRNPFRGMALEEVPRG